MPSANDIDIAGLRERIQNKRDSFEDSITMGLDEMLSILALAEIGQATVEKYRKFEAGEAEDDMNGECELMVKCKAYLARKDG